MIVCLQTNVSEIAEIDGIGGKDAENGISAIFQGMDCEKNAKGRKNAKEGVSK